MKYDVPLEIQPATNQLKLKGKNTQFHIPTQKPIHIVHLIMYEIKPMFKLLILFLKPSNILL